MPLTSIQPPGTSQQLTFQYDAYGRLLRHVDMGGNWYDLTYDFAGKLRSDSTPAVLANGITQRLATRYTSTESLVLVPSGVSTATSVRSDSLRASVINPRGFTTAFALDRWRAATRVEQPLGRVSTVSRNTIGQVTSSTAPSGQRVDYVWTGKNLTRVTDQFTGRQVNVEYEPTYNEVSRVYGHTDSLWNYWSGGKLDSVRVGYRGQPNPPAPRYLYDSRGRMVGKRDSELHSDTIMYETSGMMNRSWIDESGRNTVFIHDVYGRDSLLNPPAGSQRVTLYDQLNRITRSINPASGDTVKYYHGLLGTDSIVDPKGQVHRFGYNALGRLVTRTDPNGLADRYYYDVNGNLTASANRRNQQVSVFYDALDRDTMSVAGMDTTRWTLSPWDTLVVGWNREARDTMRFDPSGRPVAHTTVLNGRRYSISRSFDLKYNLTGVTFGDGTWQSAINYKYNVRGQMDTLIDLKGSVTRVGFNGDGQQTFAVYPGSQQSTSFATTHTPSASSYSSSVMNASLGRRYGYSKNNQLTQRGNKDNSAGHDFAYDAYGQLLRRKSWTRDTSVACPELPEGYECSGRGKTFAADSLNYAYDKAGNRTDGGAQSGWGNRLLRFSGDTMTYDSDGNLIRRYRIADSLTFNQRLYWSVSGLLDSVRTTRSSVTLSTTFGYDALGRRVRKTVGGVSSYSLWGDDDLLAELDGSGNRVIEYVYFPGIDRPHSMRRRAMNDSVFYYATDYSNNVIGLFKDSGFPPVERSYFPFGTVEDSISNSVPNKLWFAARERDAETGLYYNRGRYYSPEIARFVSEDPIGINGGLNVYSYALNNPVNGTDPTGQCINYRYSIPTNQFLGTGRSEPGQVLEGFVCCNNGAWMEGVSSLSCSYPNTGIPSPPRNGKKNTGCSYACAKNGTGFDYVEQEGLYACLGETTTATDAVGPSMMAAGEASVPKPFAGNTSYLSKWLRKKTGDFPARKLAPTLRNLNSATFSKGAFVARCTPWLGVAMTAADLSELAGCAAVYNSAQP